MAYQVMRVLLVLYVVGSFALTLFYLRYRRCNALEFAVWGMLALIVPVLGPFFVIAARPGPRKRARRAPLANHAMPSPKG